MSGDGDGRLDLDDLGSVIEGASPIDEPRDILGEDPGTTWGERLDAAGVTPWLRRHRVAVPIVTAVVLLAAGGAAAWSRAQPPPWNEPALTALQASLGNGLGTNVSMLEDFEATAAYIVLSDAPGTTAAVTGIEGPGIRASGVGPPSATASSKSTVVRAIFGCDGDALSATPADYRLRVTATDAYGRSRAEMLAVPFVDYGWNDVVKQTCWQRAAATRVHATALHADVDAGAAAVRLRIDLTSTMPEGATAQLEPTDLGALSVPLAGRGTELAPGSSTTIDGRLEVGDCSGGGPGLPQVGVPDDPTTMQGYSSADGLGITVISADGRGWGVTPLVFTEAQRADVRRALASVCAGTPRVTVDDVQVVRAVADDALLTQTFTLSVTARVTGLRQMQVGVQQGGYFIGTPEPSTVPWSVLPRGGGTTQVTWTFSCTDSPAPPQLSIRFVDGVRPTPLRVPLDQEEIAPWIGDACPLLTPATLVELGWTLP